MLNEGNGDDFNNDGYWNSGESQSITINHFAYESYGSIKQVIYTLVEPQFKTCFI